MSGYIGDCVHCPLSNQYLVSGYGKPGGLAIIGEAPGENEVRQGRPFIGVSGKLIRQILMLCDIDPNDVYWTNAVLCRPPGNKTPPVDAIRACNARLLKQELPDMYPSKVLIMGAAALTAMTGADKMKSISKYHGRGMWVDVGGKQIYSVPTFHPAAVLRDQDLFRTIMIDIEKLLTHDAPIPQPEVELLIPTTQAEALTLIEQFASASILSCDLETTGFDPYQDFMISMGFGAISKSDPSKGTSLIIGSSILRDVHVRAFLKKLFMGSRKFIFHNGKYDLKFLDRYFEEVIHPNMDDTLLLHYAIDERPGGQAQEHSLKTLARVYYDAPDYAWDFEEYFKFTKEHDIRELYEYQGYDCYYTVRLHEDLTRQVEEDSRSYKLVHETLLPASVVLRDVETYGALIDRPYLKALAIKLAGELQEMEKRLQDISGDKFLNPNSPQQLMGVLRKFPGGRLLATTGKEELQDFLRTSTDEMAVAFLETLLDFRKLAKLQQTYVMGLLERVHPDGRVRTEFLLHGSVTGRLASRNPNLQNIPHHGGGDPTAPARSKQIRDAFIAPPGYVFVEADYSGLELRAAAFYSKDERMQQVFIDGRDIHREVASQMFGKPEEEINDTERHLAKYFDFGVLYGRGAKSLAEGREMDIISAAGGQRWTVADAERFMRRFLDGFPDLKAWIRNQERRAHAEAEVDSPTGRVRRFPLILGDGLAERQSVNAPIQAFASDLCLHALMRLHNEIPRDDLRVLFTIHDSVAMEVRESKLHQIVSQIRTIMEDVRIAQTSIPFPVEIKAGPRWGSTEVII